MDQNEIFQQILLLAPTQPEESWILAVAFTWLHCHDKPTNGHSGITTNQRGTPTPTPSKELSTLYSKWVREWLVAATPGSWKSPSELRVESQ